MSPMVTIMSGRVYSAKTPTSVTAAAPSPRTFFARGLTQAPCGTGVRAIGASRTGRLTIAAKMPSAIEMYQTMS